MTQPGPVTPAESQRLLLSGSTPAFSEIAALCRPSHERFAARAGFAYSHLSWPDDGQHNWNKVRAIVSALERFTIVLWIDADAILPVWWRTPVTDQGNAFWFPVTEELPGFFHFWCYASLWRKSPESSALLAAMIALEHVCNDSLADQAALNRVLDQSQWLRASVGEMPYKIVHFHAISNAEKVNKLRAVA